MKRKISIFLALIFSIATLLTMKAHAAVDPDTMEGDPMSNANHFIWDLMADMQTPDDPDCADLAETALEGTEGMTSETITEVAGIACESLATMRTQMQADMNEMEGESVETNLWDATNWHNVENLYFEHSTNGTPDGRIAFSEPIDFMSYAFMNFMQHFGENMEAETGYISLDADTVGGFANYGASLTMYNVPDYNDPEILVDGEPDSNGIVSNIVYNRSNNTITFSAAHFSSFEVTEGDEDEEPEIDSVKAKKYFNAGTGSWRVKLKIKGDHLNSDSEVTVDNREPFKINKTGSNKITAYFSLDKLLKTGRDKLVIRVKNGDETEKFKHRLTLSELTTEYQKLD